MRRAQFQLPSNDVLSERTSWLPVLGGERFQEKPDGFLDYPNGNLRVLLGPLSYVLYPTESSIRFIRFIR